MGPTLWLSTAYKPHGCKYAFIIFHKAPLLTCLKAPHQWPAMWMGVALYVLVRFTFLFISLCFSYFTCSHFLHNSTLGQYADLTVREKGDIDSSKTQITATYQNPIDFSPREDWSSYIHRISAKLGTKVPYGTHIVPLSIKVGGYGQAQFCFFSSPICFSVNENVVFHRSEHSCFYGGQRSR